MLYRKTYKPTYSDIFRMFPSDPTGSLDDFFSVNNLIFGGKK